jgi:DNA-binding LytR/AlgR family response regulator
VLELLGPEAYSVVAPNIKSALLGQYQNFETVVPYRNVGKQFMHLAFAPDLDETGKVRGLVAAIANVTARYKAENMLQELEARLKNFEVSEKQLTKQSISIAQSKGIRNLQLSDITHIEALQGYSVIHTTSGEKIMSSMNLSSYESLPA